MRSLVSIVVFLLSFSVFANEMELDKSEIRIEIGDITKYQNSEDITSLHFIQTARTPKVVNIKLKYQRPPLECVEGTNYIAYEGCPKGGYPDYDRSPQGCVPHQVTKCGQYKYDINSSFREFAIETIRLKFKTPTEVAKAFEIKISNKDQTPESKIIKGDFDEIKVRDKTFIRFTKRVIFNK